MPLSSDAKLCVVTRMHINWFNEKFRKSECANVKRFYLSNGTKTCKEESHAVQHEILRCGDRDVAHSEEIYLEDELELIENSEWSLAKGLQAARIIALDERTLWECIGPFLQEKACEIINLWNEQIAVKLFNEFIMLPAHEISENLRAELIEHMTVHIKPKDIKPIDGQCCSQNCDMPELVSANQNVVTSLNEIHDQESEYEHWVKNTVTQTAVQVRPMKMNGHDICEGALICAKAVEAFGELLRIPRKEMFYLENIYEHCTLAITIQQLSCLHTVYDNEEIMLVLCLIFERFIVGIDNSVWRALLLTCPRAYPRMPVFWSAQDLAELEGTDVLDDVIRKREETRTFCDEITPLLSIIYTSLRENERIAPMLSESAFVNAFSYDAVLWARATFDSRAFKLNIDGNIRVTLVPLADMINHSNCSDVIVRKVLDNSGDFVMQIGAPLTHEDVHSHRELWMSYGPLQNWELLEHYGFVLAHNEFDKLPFTVSWENAYTEDHNEQVACGVAEHTNENNNICAEEEEKIEMTNLIRHQVDDDDSNVDGNNVDAKQKIGQTNVREINNYADNAASDVNITSYVPAVTDITDANTNNNILESSRTFDQVEEARLACDCAQEKREFLLNYYYLILTNQMWIPVSGVPPDALIALLRIMLCTEGELTDIYAETRQSLHHCKGPFAKLSNKTELTIINTIRTVLQEWLSSLSFSLDENVANLEVIKNDQTSNTSNDSSCDDSNNINENEVIHASANSILALELLISLQSIADRCLKWCNYIQSELQESQ